MAAKTACWLTCWYTPFKYCITLSAADVEAEPEVPVTSNSGRGIGPKTSKIVSLVDGAITTSVDSSGSLYCQKESIFKVLLREICKLMNLTTNTNLNGKHS